jgi:hypothetical protein
VLETLRRSLATDRTRPAFTALSPVEYRRFDCHWTTSDHHHRESALTTHPK